jgi:hypothetical protein
MNSEKLSTEQNYKKEQTLKGVIAINVLFSIPFPYDRVLFIKIKLHRNSL